jgi:hypothetical protein
LIDRPPSIDPPRDREIARLRRLLAELETIPEHRRVDEGGASPLCFPDDVSEAMIRAFVQ